VLISHAIFRQKNGIFNLNPKYFFILTKKQPKSFTYDVDRLLVGNFNAFDLEYSALFG